LEALYPPLLRDAGIGGRVLVKFFLLEDGTVLERAVVESSGHTALDQAALGVADVMRFSPAYNRESPVPVWVSLPIEFTVRNR
jgi:protein TonB